MVWKSGIGTTEPLSGLLDHVKHTEIKTLGAGGAQLSEVDGGFGFDDEEGIRVGAAGGAEFLAGFFEGVGENGEDDAAVGSADEVKAALLLHELECRSHAFGSIHRIRMEIKGKLDVRDR